MRTYTYICTLIALLSGFHVSALTVIVNNVVTSHCGYPTGVLQADIIGGVPPYSIAWSTGATTEVITGLPPGTYGVTVTDNEGTQATAQGDVVQYDQLIGGFTFPSLAHCPGAFPMVDLTLYNQGQWGVYVQGQPPFTITGPSSVMSSTLLPSSNPNLGSIVRVEMDVPPGSFQTVQWLDANGCPGESAVIMSTEAVWPVVSVYNIQGSCANGNNGSFAWTVTPTSSQGLTLRILRPDGSLLAQYAIDGDVTGGEQGQLSQGTYVLQVVTETIGPFGDELCSSETTVVIEDLGNTCANVNGPVFIDANTNCIWNGSTENRIPQAIVEFTPGPFYALTSTMGQYSLNLPLGTYDHTVTHPGAQQECPGPFTINAGQATVARPIGCSSLFPLDVEVSASNGPARPGFELQYAVNVTSNSAANSGASTLTFTFDPLLTFLSASPAPHLVSGNTITWNIWNVPAYLNFNWQLRFQVPPDIGLIGTVLTATANLTTANTDAVPANNSWTTQQVVTAAYDPNDKLARTSTGWSDEVYYIDQDEWIDYTIRFQNTGTDTAFNVFITDTLPATLDPATINMGTASHTFNWNLGGHGIITFNFGGILLPDSNVNEPRSHGFVSFRIRPRLPVLPGTVIENIANIYFDFNPPVITEPSIVVAEFSTSVRERPDEVIRLMPNPVNEELRINANSSIASLRIIAADGREVLTRSVRAANTSIAVDRLQAGAYLLIATFIDGTEVRERFIKH